MIFVVKRTKKNIAQIPAGWRPSELARCSDCGGMVPEVGSDAYFSGDNSCPGCLANQDGQTIMVCGAYDPDLDPRPAWGGAAA